MQSMLEPAQGIVPAWGNASWPRRRVHLSAGFGQGLIVVETYMPAAVSSATDSPWRPAGKRRQPLRSIKRKLVGW